MPPKYSRPLVATPDCYASLVTSVQCPADLGAVLDNEDWIDFLDHHLEECPTCRRQLSLVLFERLLPRWDEISG